MYSLEVSENSLIHRSKLHLENVQKYFVLWRDDSDDIEEFFDRNICIVTLYRIFLI